MARKKVKKMQKIRTRLEEAKARKALYARRRMLKSEPPVDWDWIAKMLKTL
tara:strand:+ start:319 stop:471 length:153 start_codon:yes stop_codon:yes gene_type:complete